MAEWFTSGKHKGMYKSVTDGAPSFEHQTDTLVSTFLTAFTVVHFCTSSVSSDCSAPLFMERKVASIAFTIRIFPFSIA